ncbi:uncharacterized protein LOC119190509 isoform X2 [Manduca sexta]|uniref:uncharacterized protein LOC119190509 isoform X2 n=1 Tax=Manduca sexta TaxID=7130 RepID=UPI0018900E2D|nr:uncharacterized protein LOC119190509 isoform X2 [Manduca sexta]
MIESNYISNQLDSVEISNANKCLPNKCDIFIKNNYTGLKVFHMNIRSINRHFDEMVVLLSEIRFQCDILVLSECWLSKVVGLPVLNGYTSYFTKNHKNQNDGVVLYIKSNIACSVTEPPFSDGNCLICKIGDTTSIVAIYRSPSYKSLDNFFNSFNLILSTVSCSRTTIDVGDFNIDIKPGNNDSHSGEYLTIAAMHGLFPTHTLPTRLTNCLDHILLKTNFSTTTLILETHITDHEPLLLFVDKNRPKLKPPHTFTKINYDQIAIDITNKDWTDVMAASDANLAVNLLVSSLSSIIKVNTCKCNISNKTRNLKPWITPESLLRKTKSVVSDDGSYILLLRSVSDSMTDSTTDP